MKKVVSEWKDHKGMEELFIGSALVKGATEFKMYLSALSADDFSDALLGNIFKRLCKFVEDGRDFDIAVLNNELKGIDSAYLVSLASDDLPTLKMGEYARQIRENALRRKMLKHLAEAPRKPTSDIVSELQKDIWSFQATNPGSWSIKEAIGRTLNEIEKRMEGDIEYTTGLIDFDRVTGGLRRGDVIIISGRPSMGKTAFTTNVCLHLLREKGKRVLYVDLETSDMHMLERFIGLVSKVPPSKMKSGMLSEGDLQKIVSSAAEVAKLPLEICDNTSVLPADILARARAMKADIIVLDYIHLMSDQGSGKDDNERIGNSIRALKAIAMELKIPVIVLAQLNREVERRTERKPQLSDLRGSGTLEQVGDVICAMHWEWKYDEMAEFNESMIRVLKQKTGPAQDIRLYFNPELMEYKNFEMKEEEGQAPQGVIEEDLAGGDGDGFGREAVGGGEAIKVAPAEDFSEEKVVVPVQAESEVGAGISTETPPSPAPKTQ